MKKYIQFYVPNSPSEIVLEYFRVYNAEEVNVFANRHMISTAITSFLFVVLGSELGSEMLCYHFFFLDLLLYIITSRKYFAGKI